ncbi:MAG: hypothetical protein KF712_13855 [Akkermansiaceae bacterium]|nr:hypothetical protein [Akkermansiaceae bacterium]
MNLSQLKSLLATNSGSSFRIRLPDGLAVPVSFHVTEVGRVQKTFLDCGGKLRESIACQLQVWVGSDYDHRLETGKMAAILDKAKDYLPDEAIPVEVEYEDTVISQYTIEGHEVSDDAVVLILAHKHTECLAPELCGLPPLPGAGKAKAPAVSCCGPKGCC